MSLRAWLGLAVLAVAVNAAVLACALNPQPLPPIDDDDAGTTESTPEPPGSSLGDNASGTGTDAGTDGDAGTDAADAADAPTDAGDAG